MKTLFRFALPVFMCLVLSSGLAQAQSLWSAGTDMPTERKEIANATVSLDGKIYVIGGVSSNTVMLNTVEVYTPATDSWETVAPLPVPAWRVGAAVVNGKIYVFGGYLALNPFPFNPSDRVFEYNPATDSWSEKAKMPTARGAPLALAFNNQIHVMGGSTNISLTTHEIYNPGSNSWSNGADMPQNRSALTGDVVGNQIFVAGGFRTNQGGDAIPYAELLRYDPGSNTWADPAALAPVPEARFGMDAGNLDGQLYIFGGNLGFNGVSRTLRYDPPSNQWEELEEMPQAYSFMGVGQVERKFYAFGGGATNLDPTDAVATNRVFSPDGPTGSPFYINAGLSDAWFDPATNGQGFFITIYPDIKQMYLAWFTFDTERPPEGVLAQLGDAGHRWITALGPYDGDTAVLTVYMTEGGVFDSVEPATETDLDGDGTMTFEFADCTAGIMTYHIDSINASGEIPIQRVANDNVPLCESLNTQ